MAKYCLELTWVLLLFCIFCPIKILGQYALPSLNSNTPNVNPAVIPWRTKSSISLGSEYKKLEYGEPKYSVEISRNSYGMFAVAGDFFLKTTILAEGMVGLLEKRSWYST